MSLLKRIAVVGPESTGKSVLSHELAKSLNGSLVIEMARSYLDQLKAPYREEDLLKIAQLQIAEEDGVASKTNSGYLICDTNLIVIRIWSLHKYGRCHPWIEEELHKRIYHLHLLCNIDLPWADDPQREHPHLRDYLFNKYHKTLIDLEIPFEIITGMESKRLENALKSILLL